jgi:type IV pilus assembly protein PilF
LHQQSEPTAESVWLGVRTERRLGNRDAESSYAEQLRGRFADSAELRAMNQGSYE